jgi:hypothetical protein
MGAVKMRFWHEVQQDHDFYVRSSLSATQLLACSNANSIYLQKTSRTGEQPITFVQFKPLKSKSNPTTPLRNGLS